MAFMNSIYTYLKLAIAKEDKWMVRSLLKAPDSGDQEYID